MAHQGSRRARPKAPPAAVSHADVPAPVAAHNDVAAIEPPVMPDLADISAVALAAADGDLAYVPPIVLPDEALTPLSQNQTTAEKDSIMDLNTAAQTVSDTTQAQATQMFAEAQTRTEDMMGKSTRALEEMNALAKGNVEAIVESSKIAAKGFETLGQDAAESTRRAFENMTAAVKAMASVKSPTELMKLQGDYARTAFDMVVAQTSQSTERMMKLAGEVAQPISNRVAIAAEKMKVAA